MDSAPDVTLLNLATNRCSVRSGLFERELFGQEKGTVTGAAGGLFTVAGQNALDSIYETAVGIYQVAARLTPFFIHLPLPWPQAYS